MKTKYFKALPSEHQNWSFSMDCLPNFKRATSKGKLIFFSVNALPFRVSPWKSLDFHKSASFKENTDFNQFSKESLLLFGVFMRNITKISQILYRPVVFRGKWFIFTDFTEITGNIKFSCQNIRFSRNIIQNTNFPL